MTTDDEHGLEDKLTLRFIDIEYNKMFTGSELTSAPEKIALYQTNATFHSTVRHTVSSVMELVREFNY